MPSQRQVPWYWVVTLNTTSLGPFFSFRLFWKTERVLLRGGPGGAAGSSHEKRG